MNIEVDVRTMMMLRTLLRIGLLSKKTYSHLGEHILLHGAQKSSWRQTSWKEFLKNG